LVSTSDLCFDPGSSGCEFRAGGLLTFIPAMVCPFFGVSTFAAE
jgi:hypothetical protein